MEEAQVTIDAVTHLLPQPFFVIATQNPSSQIGTFALPESQLDRFLMRITLDYPDAASERRLLQSNGGRDQLAHMTAVIDSDQLQALQTACQNVYVSDALLDYLQAILKYSRQSTQFNTGLSPRAGLSLKQCAQAWAMIAGRDHVIPEDIQAVLPSVVGHRLVNNGSLDSHSDNINSLLKAVAIP
jgi:MoxR-like ATPase